MSGCAHGGRDTYRRPDTKHYIQEEPERGAVVFADGSTLPLVWNKRMSDGSVREAVAVVINGVPFKPDDADETWLLDDGSIREIAIGDVRYVRRDRADKDVAEVVDK